MKYIIMANGGNASRHLVKIKGEPLVQRTIRLLKEAGVEDIAISSNFPELEAFGVPTIKCTVERRIWLDGAFPAVSEPVCYIFGDVLFSPKAIKTIVETQTEDVEFFASAPPFGPWYRKHWAEPFAFKVVNFKHFAEAQEKAREYYKSGKLRRLIAWELWQVIKGTELGRIDYTNFTKICDYTCDIDTEADAEDVQCMIQSYQFLLKE